MEDFLHTTINRFPACRIFTVRHTKEVVCWYGHGHYVLKKDSFNNYYWKTDWNGHGNL